MGLGEKVRARYRRVTDGLGARALDELVLWQFGTGGIAMPRRREYPAVDAAEFWRTSGIHAPGDVRVAADRGRAHGDRVRALDLEGPSSGPGDHPGSHKLMARAYLRDDLGPRAPLVILLHGFAVSHPAYEEWQARLLTACGAHVVRLDLPYHLRRRVRGHRSGSGYLTADLGRMRGCIRQSVEDVAALVRWGRQGVAASVSIFGPSLGGLIGALLAAHVEVDGLVAMAPFCDPPRTFITHLPARTRRRIGLTDGAGGPWATDVDSARAVLTGALAPVVPLNFRPVTAPRRIALVLPRYDRVVGTEPVRQLAEGWGTDLWPYPSGHLSILMARGVIARVHDRLLQGAGPQ